MPSFLTIAAFAVALLALLWSFALSRRLSGATRPKTGEADPPLALKVADRATDLEARVAALEGAAEALRVRVEADNERVSTAIRHLGMVRYDALPGAAGEQSFSIAMLDDRRNGFVLTGIYGRAEYRFYAKPVTARESQYPLSEEEQAAMTEAERANEPVTSR